MCTLISCTSSFQDFIQKHRPHLNHAILMVDEDNKIVSRNTKWLVKFHSEWTCIAPAHIFLTKESQMATLDNGVMNYALPTGSSCKSHAQKKDAYFS